VLAPLVVPPFVGALGLRILFGSELDGVGPSGAGRWLGWVCWTWLGGVCGLPLVALAVGAALRRVEPAWVDAARLAGARPFRIWRQLVWPIIRPDAARAAATIFTLTLVEPGAPLVLGLRRTLGFQLVEAALAPEPFPRAAVLAMLAVGFALAGRVLALWWGGPRLESLPTLAHTRFNDSRWTEAIVWAMVLTTTAIAAWCPIVPVVAAAVAPGSDGASSSWFRALVDAPSRGLLANSLVLGLAVCAVSFVVAWALASWSGHRRFFRIASSWPDLFPPLTLGVGALALPWVARLSAASLDSVGYGGAPAGALGVLAGALAPSRAPSVWLVIAVVATRQPFLARAVAASRARARWVLYDAAINLGATPRGARGRSLEGWFGASPGALLLTCALAATCLAPALVVAPSPESRPISPAVVILADTPGDGRTNAARLATVVVGFNVLALALAARGRSAVPDDELRGAA
jgi:iron(III) transport system permease protein